MSKNIEPVILPTEGYVRLPVVLATFGVQKSKIWAMIKEGKFPAPKKFGNKTALWDVRELRDIMERLSREGSV